MSVNGYKFGIKGQRGRIKCYMGYKRYGFSLISERGCNFYNRGLGFMDYKGNGIYKLRIIRLRRLRIRGNNGYMIYGFYIL